MLNRQWLREVLQPLNEKAADIIINRLNLVESANLDPVLLELVSHTYSLRVLLKRYSAYTQVVIIKLQSHCFSNSSRIF